MTTRGYRGHLLHIAGSPATYAEASAALISEPDGLLVVDDAGIIVYSGRWDERGAIEPDLVTDLRPGYLIPGFIDTHIHFAQTFATDAYGGGLLLDWLEKCIFPAESRYADPEFARMAAAAFCRRRISVGTTTAMVFGSAFPAAQDALFTESIAAGLRTVTGRGVQTVGPPSSAALLTTPAAAIELCRTEIDTWHGAGDGLIQSAVIPRFALSLEPSTMVELSELYDDVRARGVYFHTHVSENATPGTGEIDATLGAYGIDRYLDAYDGRPIRGHEAPTMLGRRSVLAHGVHCHDDELARLAQTGTAIAHCPTSQQFLGSGTMPFRKVTDAGVTVALGTDVGAGDEWLISRVANDCFKVQMSHPVDPISLEPAQLLMAATLSGARALDLESVIGNLDVGKEADFIHVDPSRSEHHALQLEVQRTGAVDAERAVASELFTLLLGMREDAIAGVWVRGRDLRAVV